MALKREGHMDNENTQEIEQVTEQETAPVEKTFTQEQLNAIIDKRLERERKDAQARIDKAVTEAQKLAKMNAEERAQHERDELQKKLAQREAEMTKQKLQPLSMLEKYSQTSSRKR